MRTADFEGLKKCADGTLFTCDSPDTFVRHAVLEKGVDQIPTSASFLIYEGSDLRRLQEKIEFALKLLPHKTEYEP